MEIIRDIDSYEKMEELIDLEEKLIIYFGTDR